MLNHPYHKSQAFLQPRHLKVSSGIVPSGVRSAVKPSPLQGIEGTPGELFQTIKVAHPRYPALQRLRSFQFFQLGGIGVNRCGTLF